MNFCYDELMNDELMNDTESIELYIEQIHHYLKRQRLKTRGMYCFNIPVAARSPI